VSDADLRILDTHVHYWDRSVQALQWSWLDHFAGASRLLRSQRYTASEYLADVSELAVAGAVHIQSAESSDPVAESRWLDGMAECEGAPGAIVADCSLIEPTAAETLRRQGAIGRVRGIRDMSLPADVTPERIAAGLDELSHNRLSVEIRLPLDRFETLARLARGWPDVTFVLGSAGLPMGPAQQPDPEWVEALAYLAPHENWVCKISGLIRRLGVDWSHEQVAPFIQIAIQTFGPRRVMFGTNWPLESTVADLADIIDVYRAQASELSPSEGAAVCSETAARVYRWDADAPAQ
jgi:predicted TIM-barrel fold metal-dependent hydrolase